MNLIAKFNVTPEELARIGQEREAQRQESRRRQDEETARWLAMTPEEQEAERETIKANMIAQMKATGCKGWDSGVEERELR